jgi:Mrp family chromosome partitioning ATPase
MEELKNFKTNNDLVNSTLESEDKIRQVSEKENQIAAEQQRIRGLELTLANLKLRIEDAEMSTGQGHNDQIVTLRRRINDVNDKYIRGGQTDNTLLDSVTLLRRQLDAVMRKINQAPKLSTAEISSLKTRSDETRMELEIARENLASLTKTYNSLRYGMGDFASKEARGNALEKEVEVASQEYLAAQNRFNEAREKIVTNKTSISQIIMAEPAEKAESRKTMIFMVFSGVLGFVISAFTIIVIELADTRIKTIQRLRKLTRMKVAGIIPKMKKAKINGDMVFSGGDKQSQKRINEEVRKIRFEIDGHKARVLLVTSAKTAQGKSFFIVALSYSLSLLKKRVLIIDTNLRNNTLTKMLVAQGNLQLLLDSFSKNTKLLESHTNGGPKESTANFDFNLISKTHNNLIDIIGNKKSQMSPSELIPGGDFKVLLEWLKVQYDYIILEGPALNYFSDSKELAGFVDLVIPVFSADSTVDAEDTDALNYLKTLHHKLGPSILNNVQQVQ